MAAAVAVTEYRAAQIFVAADNFGCGPSREGAVWALAGSGHRAAAGALEAIREQLERSPGATMTIDLAAQQVTLPDGTVESFEVDPIRREGLLAGAEARLTPQREAR